MRIQFKIGGNRAGGGEALRPITVLISGSDFRTAFSGRTITSVLVKLGQMTNGHAMKAEKDVVSAFRIDIGAETFSPRLDEFRMVEKRLQESQAIFTTEFARVPFRFDDGRLEARFGILRVKR